MNAYLYLLDKQYKTSETKFVDCIKTGDSSRFNIKNLGIAHFKTESFDTAKYYLEKAYLMDTTDVNNLHFLGIACSKSTYKKLGIYYTEKAIQQMSGMEDEYAALYRNLVEACRSWSPCPCENILSVSLKALALHPKDSSLLYIIGYGYDYCKKDKQKAIEYFTQYLNTRPINKETVKYDKPLYDRIEKRLNELKSIQ
jgi:tetratricopeptide (TPR) repeat protein